jgi:hypothetical protein
VSAEVDAGGDFAEMAAADERGAKTGELTFARGWEAAEEGFGYGETEDGITEELELLVVGCGVGEGFGFGLVGEGAMGESPGEEVGAAEAMVEGRMVDGRRRGALLLRASGLFVPCRQGGLLSN